MFKNVASQIAIVYAHDTLSDAPKTGDAANITARISKDGGAFNVTDDTNPTEMDSTNALGLYKFDLLLAETNCDLFALYAKSTTSGIQILPVIVYTILSLVHDTVAEMAQGAPSATPTFGQLLNYLYRVFRNKSTQDGTTKKVYNDAKDTVLFKASTTDAGGVFTKDEFVSGP